MVQDPMPQKLSIEEETQDDDELILDEQKLEDLEYEQLTDKHNKLAVHLQELYRKHRTLDDEIKEMYKKFEREEV